MAWTEDPEDELAAELQQRFGHGFDTLGALATGLNVPNDAAAKKKAVPRKAGEGD
jgi:hypothetical protein